MSGEDRAFFEQMRGCRDAYRRLADCIDAVVGYMALGGSPDPGDAIQYLDLGAGMGYVIERLKERGKPWSLAYDASPIPAEMGAEVQVADLSRETQRGVYDAGFAVRVTEPEGVRQVAQIVICTETAEHIAPEHADAVVRNVARCARRRIVWSAAGPGQEWPGHVNLQPGWWWLDKFGALGWEDVPRATAQLRRLMRETHAQHEHAADNFFVLGPR